MIRKRIIRGVAVVVVLVYVLPFLVAFFGRDVAAEAFPCTRLWISFISASTVGAGVLV